MLLEDNSDIDILVELPESKSLLDLITIKMELEDELNMKVDLQTYNALNPLIRNNVLSEQVVVL